MLRGKRWRLVYHSMFRTLRVSCRPSPIRWGICNNGFNRTAIRHKIDTTFYDWENVKTKKKKTSKPLMALLILMPVIAFGLGTWQVKRLKWKQELIATAEYQLSRPPLKLPLNVNADAVSDFDYRRVLIEGVWDHSKEMLVGPRLHEGKNGFFVVTPIVRKNGSTLLVNRGWIAQDKQLKSSRPESLQKGVVQIECLLRKKPKPNRFTPKSDPAHGMYHFMDIDEMARRTGSQPIYIQQLENTDELMLEQQALRGMPIGYPAKIEFRNTHFQYIVTWYGLGILTSIMLFMMLKQSRGQKAFDASIKAKVAHARKWQ